MSVVIPTYGQAAANLNPGAAPQRLGQDVQNLAPLATTYHSPQPTQYSDYVQPSSAKGSNLSQFGHFMGGLIHQTGSIAEGAGKWLATQTEHLATAPIRYGQGISNAYLDRSTLAGIDAQNSALTSKMDNLSSMYKTGRISSQQYKAGLKEINQDTANNSRAAQAINIKVASDQKNAYQATIDTASLLTTILTAGFGKAALVEVGSGLKATDVVTAGQFLKGKAASAYLGPVESALGKIAGDSKAFNALSDAAKAAVQKATAEVVSTGANMSAGQIARASAANLALKYPIYYNLISSTGDQLYTELQDKKYGDAVNTLAFNAALVLSGGPIGQAVKYLGKFTKGTIGATFGQSSFMDIASKELFGDESALYNAAKDNPVYAKAIKTLEATHMSVTGNDPVAAAWRLINGERSIDGSNAIVGGAGAWLDHLVDWAEESKAVAAEAKRTGLPPIILGRWTVSNANMVADHLSQLPKDQWEKGWADLKAQFPNSAFANNPNLDSQVKFYLANSDTPETLSKKIKSIEAGRYAAGLSVPTSTRIAKKGFVAIAAPKSSQVFKEGKGALTTKYTESNDEFFTRATQPLPVLSTVGAALRGMGLSPQASSERSYQLFNENVAGNLEKTSAASSITERLGKKAAPKAVVQSSSSFSADELKNLQSQGFTPEMISKMEKAQFSEGAIPTAEPIGAEAKPTKQVSATDYMMKRLSSYAKGPTRSGLLKKAAAPDLRMLTNKDIQTALKITRSQATEIQNAIALAHIQIPLAVKGLGDRAVDYLYSTPGLRAVSRRFLKTQGILRFGANPFFQYLRVIPKTEILASSEGGGFTKTLWNGQARELKGVRNTLRKAGLLDEVGHLGNLTGAEGVDFAGATSDAVGSGKNLAKKLLPAQENSIAGIIIDQAKRMGMSTDDYIATFPEKAKDTIQAIAEYDRKSSFLNSPLARTLNVAVFPFRFDAKVLTIMGRNLGKADLFTQVAFIKGMMGAHDWLNSDQGKAWYSQNADAIGLFKYITPFANFNEIFHSLVPGNDHSLGNFGQLGGLPFGWIPSLLDSEGLTHFNAPGVDPKTGQTFTKYIPIDARGQVATAIQDLLSSMFSYPGATVGLPSKNKATLALAEGVTGAKSADFKKITPPGGTPATAPASDSSAPLQSVAIPAQPSPANTVRVKSPTAKKKKKSEFTPQLLPGQSQLGQL